jgi:hypothetical protein
MRWLNIGVDALEAETWPAREVLALPLDKLTRHFQLERV